MALTRNEGARVVRQPLPDPPDAYNQEYMFRLVNALNLFMLQSAQAQAEQVAARYIATAPVYVDPSKADPDSVPDTTGLPTGLIYFLRNTTYALGTPQAYFATIVKETDV